MATNNSINFISIASDSGSATQATGTTTGYTFAGSGGVTTSASGSTITIDGSGVGGGDWVLISTATASSSTSITFTNLSSTYFAYKIIIDNLQPVTDGTNLWMRTSTNNGSSYDSSASDYSWAVHEDRANVTKFDDTDGNAGDSKILLHPESDSMGNASNEIGAWEVILFNPSATNYTLVNYQGYYHSDGSSWYSVRGGGARLSAADVDAIQFLMSSGNISIGNFRLYGMVSA